MVKMLDNAAQLWNSPQAMVKMWETSEEKQRHELLVKDWVSGRPQGSIVDLGCGAGRFADVLEYESYIGYDQSSAMIQLAREKALPYAEFACVDIFSFQTGVQYDLALLIDVAYHQDQPVEAVLKIVNLWQAHQYLFTLLVGERHEDLYNSTVVSYGEFLTLVDALGPGQLSYHIERYGPEQFSWMLVSYER